ncbi:hypothetical protein LBMAG27_25350 [Bacteroidota bacterium]|nr:hypothetical protein LBMAG27_25350 [Bacteroidota bacterium]
MKPQIIIIGAGGHGKVVCDAILAQNKFEVKGFVDATIPVETAIINNYKVIAHQNDLASLKSQNDFFVVAIGNNPVREKVFNTAIEFLQPATIIHPSAVIGSEVKIGEGTVVLAKAVINAFSVIGKNTIVNAGVVVDHECIVGDNAHLSIGTMMGSNSNFEKNRTSAIGERINSFSK